MIWPSSSMVFSACAIAAVAAMSASSGRPRPIQRPAASAAASVAWTNPNSTLWIEDVFMVIACFLLRGHRFQQVGGFPGQHAAAQHGHLRIALLLKPIGHTAAAPSTATDKHNGSIAGQIG